MQLKIENDSARLQPLIEQYFRNLDKDFYYDRRFDKVFIADIARKFLKKRGIKTLWDDNKMYEYAFNCIEFLNITLPKFQQIRKTLGLNNSQICKVLEIKNDISLHNHTGKNTLLRRFNATVELVTSSIA